MRSDVSKSTDYLVAGTKLINVQTKARLPIEDSRKYKAAEASRKCRIISVEDLKTMCGIVTV